MIIDLNSDQQNVMDKAIRSGAYHSPDEVLGQAFELIRAQLDLGDWMVDQREAIAAHIAVGFAQAERGELMDGEVAIELLRRKS